jgi:nitrogen fixation protein FixH
MTQSPNVRRRPGWWYPYIFVGAFGVVLAVNLFFMFSAVHTFSGLSTEQAYDKGLKFNEEIAAAKRQQELGWKVGSEVRALEPSGTALHNAEIVVTFLDRDGVPVTGLMGNVLFVRPTAEGYDTKIGLAEQGQGRYVVSAALPLGGQWEMTVAAQRGDLSYQFVQRIFLP